MSKPNILLIIGDDIGVDRAPWMGEHQFPGTTPNLDSLAAGGAWFRNAWAFPVCSPTRASLLMGMWPHRVPSDTEGFGVADGVSWIAPDLSMDPNPSRTLPRMLKSTGYKTFAIGKWHLVNKDWNGGGVKPYLHPVLMGFDKHQGLITNVLQAFWTYFSWERNDADSGGASQDISTEYATTVAIDDAIACIESAGEDPWFTYLALNAAHEPFHEPPAHLHTFDPANQNPPALHRKMAMAMDTEIGRLLGHVDLENTVVIYISDNGTPGSVTTTPFIAGHAKGHVYEEGVNVPMIVNGPGIGVGESQALVSTVDLYATILKIAGLKQSDVPGGWEDSDPFIAELLDPSSPGGRSWVFTERWMNNGIGDDRKRWAIRDETFKLIRRENELLEVEFFNVDADPHEQNRLNIGMLGPGQQQHFDDLSSQLDAIIAS